MKFASPLSRIDSNVRLVQVSYKHESSEKKSRYSYHRCPKPFHLNKTGSKAPEYLERHTCESASET